MYRGFQQWVCLNIDTVKDVMLLDIYSLTLSINY